jgi:integrase/recombinase XerD
MAGPVFARGGVAAGADDPDAHVRQPRVDYESHAVAMDRNELGTLLVAAGLGPSTEHALISVRALNGLQVSEATAADIEHLGLERGHRALTTTRKDRKVVTIPLAPRTAQRSTWPPVNAGAARCSWL